MGTTRVPWHAAVGRCLPSGQLVTHVHHEVGDHPPTVYTGSAGYEPDEDGMIEVLTAKQQWVLDALDELEGEGTTREIAEKVGLPVRSVSTTLTYLRGVDLVDDGSTSTKAGDGVAWSPPPPGPIRWTVKGYT